MKTEHITFGEVKRLISDILNYKPTVDFELTPNELFCVIEETGIILEYEAIKDWYEFEIGNGHLSFQSILKNTKLNLKLHSQLIIITDECFNSQKAYKVSSNNFFEFSEHTYGDIHGMDLLQPSDIILIQPETNSICMIHHDGFLLEY